MRRGKRIAAALLSLLLILTLIPVQVQAQGNIDTEKNVSLTISWQDGDTPLTGAQFDLFLIATVDAYGELTPTDTFEQFHVDIEGKNDDAWRELAATLEGYILRDQITPDDSGMTDGQGILTFPCEKKELTQGLYLVRGHRHIQGDRYYDASSFMVMLPTAESETNDWEYDMTVSPKFESGQIPEEPVYVTRKALKVWDDDGYEDERPEEIVVQLLRGDQIYDTVSLSADNNWRYEWTDLDGSYEWTVVEKETEGYTVEVSRESDTYVITNTYDEPTPTVQEKTTLPQTGQLWWPVPVLITAGLLLIVIGLVRRRGGSDEES